MNKTIKKITSIGVATAMVAATLTGAMADLSSLPAPFVKDGMADFQLVIGGGAVVDMIGAIDIATQYQSLAVSEESVNVPGSSASSSVEDGVKIGGSQSLLLGDDLASVESGTIDDGDLEDLLADGTIDDQDDNEEYDYTQTLTVGANTVEFDADNSDMDEPILYLDLTADDLLTYEISLKGSDSFDTEEFQDSESITMLGKTFTFAPDNDNTGEVKLFGSDTTEYLSLNEPKSFTVDGKTYTVEIIGGNSDNDNVIVSVNGVSKTLQEGDSETINGLDLFAKDIFVTNIPTLSAAATLFVGSQEVVFPAAGNTAEVEIDGETVNGVEVTTNGANGAVTGFTIVFNPADYADDISGFDEMEWLEADESVMDPLFGTFAVLFAGGNYANDDSSKSPVEITGADDELTVKFTNNEGQEITFKPFAFDGSDDVQLLDDVSDGYVGIIAANSDTIVDGDIFAVNEIEGSETTTHLFEVMSFTTEDGDDVVRLKNLATGDTESYADDDELVDGVLVQDPDTDDLSLSVATVDVLFLEGGKNFINLRTTLVGDANMTFSLHENATAMDDATASVVLFSLTNDEDDFDVTIISGTDDGDEDDDGDFGHYLTEFGTYLLHEADENDYVHAFVPMDDNAEVHYEVFIAPTDATVVKSGSSVTTQKVNPIIGAAVTADEVNLATTKTNLIVIGGPCANSVAAELLENPADCTEGFTQGKAIIQLFELDNGKVAMLVAGYTAEETQAASRAVALRNSALKGSSASLTVTSAKEFTVSSQ